MSNQTILDGQTMCDEHMHNRNAHEPVWWEHKTVWFLHKPVWHLECPFLNRGACDDCTNRRTERGNQPT